MHLIHNVEVAVDWQGRSTGQVHVFYPVNGQRERMVNEREREERERERERGMEGVSGHCEIENGQYERERERESVGGSQWSV